MHKSVTARRNHGLLVVLVVLFAVASSARADELATPVGPAAAPAPSSPAAAAPNDVAALLEEGNGHYDKRPDRAELRQAIGSYEKALIVDAKSYEALWRLARAHWFLAEEEPKQNRKALFKKGIEYAERARAADPRGTEGHYWFAANTARHAEERGILDSLFAIKPIMGALRKTLELDPKHCWAHHVLGVVYRKIPGWPLSEGDIDKSLEHAQIAVRLCPDAPLVHIGLGETLLALDRDDEARRALEQALAAPGMADMKAETARHKRTARALLDEMK